MKRSKSGKDAAVAESPIIKRRKSNPSSATKEEEHEASPPTESPTKAAAGDERALYGRDPISPKPIPENSKSLKIITWNVNGLNALVQSKKHVLDRLVETHAPDLLCLQETKIQDSNIGNYTDLLPGYEPIFSCSTVKKGYSGTCVLVKKNRLTFPVAPSSVSVAAPSGTEKKKSQQSKLSSFFGASKAAAVSENAPITVAATVRINDSVETVATITSVTKDLPYFNKNGNEESTGDGDVDRGVVCPGEGRVITVETDGFYLINAYVPNSGEGLKRLDYRIHDWDPALRAYLYHLHNKKPVIFTGDMNVGHLDIDIHNPTARHIVKQAGLTPQERASFTELLSGPLKDAFRYFYPSARGQFTYWSQRTFARPVNRGLRLDYFLCSVSLLETQDNAHNDQWRAHDCYILQDDTIGCSDHCPVALVLVSNT
jgi:exodeoxyribonuclease III